tara:strand:- start:756 stop:1118 length:363 start_codon:yes stop_codon:yes gene_type:complete
MILELYKPYRLNNGAKAVTVDYCKTTDLFEVHVVDLGDYYYYHPNGVYESEDRGFELSVKEEWSEPKTGTLWVNIYEDGLYWPNRSRAEANNNAEDYLNVCLAERIACVEVNWTEGEGLD